MTTIPKGNYTKFGGPITYLSSSLRDWREYTDFLAAKTKILGASISVFCELQPEIIDIYLLHVMGYKFEQRKSKSFYEVKVVTNHGYFKEFYFAWRAPKDSVFSKLCRVLRWRI